MASDIGGGAPPRISVVVPAHNSRGTLGRALASVYAQSLLPLEILVVDDASSDGTSREAEEAAAASREDPPLRLFRREAPGPGGYAARNLGIAEAKGEWVAFLDADDLWDQRHLEAAARCIEEHPEAAFISAGWRNRYDDGRTRLDEYTAGRGSGEGTDTGTELLAEADFFSAWIDRGPLAWTSVVCVKREALLAAGAFPEGRCRRGGDIDTWVRLVLRGYPLHRINAPSGTYFRGTPQSVTKATLSNIRTCTDETIRRFLRDNPGLSWARPLKRFSNRMKHNGFKMHAEFSSVGLRDIGLLYLTVEPLQNLLFFGFALVPSFLLRPAYRLLRRLRDVLRLRSAFRRRLAAGRTAMDGPDGSDAAGTAAYVRLADPAPTRRIYQAVTLLLEAGFTVFFRIDFLTYRNWNSYGRRIFETEGCLPVRRRPGRFALAVSDSSRMLEKIGAGGARTRRLLLDYDFLHFDPERPAPALYYPITEHPKYLREGGSLRPAESEREKTGKDRKMPVFFAGNIDRKVYDRPHFREKYGILNRWETVRYLREDEALDGRTAFYREYRDFRRDLEDGLLSQKIVIFDSKSSAIPTDQWPAVLARCRYFLALPGYSQPFCHNVVEAMSAGAVPLLQFPRMFHPHLEEGRDCIAYENYEELSRKALRILEGDYDEIEEGLRKGALEYRRQHLSLDTAAEKLLRWYEAAAGGETCRLVMARDL